MVIPAFSICSLALLIISGLSFDDIISVLSATESLMKSVNFITFPKFLSNSSIKSFGNSDSSSFSTLANFLNAIPKALFCCHCWRQLVGLVSNRNRLLGLGYLGTMDLVVGTEAGFLTLDGIAFAVP